METYSQLKQALQSGGLSDNEKKNMLQLLQHTTTSLSDDRYDDAYIHCLLRPEEGQNVRIPTQYGRHSCTIKQQSSFIINTGANGEGLFCYLPQDFAFTSAYFLTDTTAPAEVAPALNTGVNSDSFKRLHAVKALDNTELNENFQSARVVAASINVRWIGDDDDETGILCASHLYDYHIGLIDIDKIENGHHAVQHRPGKGLRMIYLPRSPTDFEFCSLDTKIMTSKATTTLYGLPNHSFNPGEYLRGGEPLLDTLGEKPIYLAQRGVGTTETALVRVGTPIWVPQAQTDQRQVMDYIGTGPRSAYMNNPLPQVMAFYFKGMPANKAWLKVDVIRHLELTPRPFLREMVAIQRPIHCDKSQALALKLASTDSRHVVSTLEQAEQHKPLVTAGIATAKDSNSLLAMINHAMWPPAWSGPIGDMARWINKPQREIFHALTGMTDQQYLQGIIPAGIAAVGTVATGGTSALVPFVAGMAESYVGKEMADTAMSYLSPSSDQRNQQQQQQQQQQPYRLGKLPRNQMV